jgi:hypothetical protein
MASPQLPETRAAAPGPGLLAALAARHKEVAYVLFAAAVAFFILPATLLIIATNSAKGWTDALGPLFFWGLGCATACAAVGAGAVTPATGQTFTPTDRMRLLLLILGATLGILTAILGMTLPFTARFSPTFLGGAEEWRTHRFDIILVVAALIGGFAVAFASLQLARGVEREHALMRRLLYGFSAGFTALLLVCVLLLVNLLPYLGRYDPLPFLNMTFDWTQSRLYTLSDRSRAELASLKEPLKAYVMGLDSSDPVGDEIITMLQNCREATPQLTWERVSSLDRKRIQELVKQYQEKIIEEDQDPLGRRVFSIRPGVLLVYGEPPREKAAFLPRDAMAREEPGSGPGGGREIFLGEGVLMKAVKSLAEGKLVVYFTQGDGEMDFNGLRADGLALLQRELRSRESYDMKELKFDAGATEVPKDANVVVVARPQSLKPEALKALGAYMGFEYNDADGSFRDSPGGRKGRLCVLMDVSVANKAMVRTKLEPLLEKFGVSLPGERVLSFEAPGDPTVVQIQTNPASSNKVAKAFGPPNKTIFVFSDVRPVRSAPGGPFNVEGLVETADSRVWTETNLADQPEALAAAHAKNPSATFSPGPIPVAVAVSEQAAVPNDPFHAGVSAPGGPRMVVFGNAEWISNIDLNEPSNFDRNYSLFTSCVSWLRGDPDIGAAPQEVDENKVRPKFDLNLTTGGFWTTVLLPATHMLLAVLAAGVGVWLVRRR